MIFNDEYKMTLNVKEENVAEETLNTHWASASVIYCLVFIEPAINLQFCYVLKWRCHSGARYRSGIKNIAYAFRAPGI